MTKKKIDPEIYELYDEYCHSSMDRREFFAKAAAISVAGLAMAQALIPDYATAQEVPEKDDRFTGEDVSYKSPGGNGETIKGYLVHPKGKGPFPAVLVIHENRGLNPYIRDVARRLAVAGYVAFAPDALSPLGGYPGNDDQGKIMQAKLDRDKIHIDFKNAAYFLKNHALSNGKLGATGFCFGGGVANYLAVQMGDDIKVSVPFYGASPAPEDVKKIKADMLIHYAENDEKFNATRAQYEEALKKNKVKYEMYTYKGTEHGFHNYSTPRYNKEAAKLAWDRTLAYFKKNLV